ncbi:class I SAM-dependent methyltransferase [Phytoactinopolyspora limicola]|uniref:class I SAM-dependent methyltransferase n=1 Tax=Phytoactinopolyspora limicola TaxID=2715536 RepID=UPI001A9C9683|nr:class I SAM-dependent methyltransferase [Phytoactinopolyspora limicola]
MTTTHRMYGALATWWPLISPPEEYTGEAAYAAALLGSAEIPVHEVLELGSGGGHNAVHLTSRFTMTLVDLSDDMLAMSRRLNPGCEHLQGDMRDLRLGRTFDAVFVHDAVDYMLDETDLAKAVRTAFVHCRPGGVAVFVPDHTRETFQPATEHGGSDDDTGCGARYLAWTWDPDPADTWVCTEYAFLLRGADGAVHTSHETHRTGLFSRDTWLHLLGDAGFDAQAAVEVSTDDRLPRDVFIAHRPSTSGTPDALGGS